VDDVSNGELQEPRFEDDLLTVKGASQLLVGCGCGVSIVSWLDGERASLNLKAHLPGGEGKAGAKVPTARWIRQARNGDLGIGTMADLRARMAQDLNDSVTNVEAGTSAVPVAFLIQ
jgi:hypothetical protein